MFPQRNCTLEQLGNNRFQCSVLLWMDIVDVRRNQGDCTVLRDGKVRGKPLELPRDGEASMIWRFRHFTFTGLWILDECPVVDEWIERGVNEVEYLVVGPGMPVFLPIRNALERGYRSDQFVPKIARDQGVRLPDAFVGSDLTT